MGEATPAVNTMDAEQNKRLYRCEELLAALATFASGEVLTEETFLAAREQITRISAEIRIEHQTGQVLAEQIGASVLGEGTAP